MPDSKISDLTADTAPTTDDLIVTVNAPGTTPANKRVTIASLFGLLYPVGSLFISTLSTNPGTLLGVGTWAVFGAGRTLVSLDSGDTDFDTVEETRGAKTHTLSEAEMPAHTHTTSLKADATSGSDYPHFFAGTGGGVVNATTSSKGSGSAHNNIQPSIVVYMWKRTA
jgi:hypothetical protein